MTTRELMRDYVGCARRGDWERAFGYFSEDVRIRIPGGSALAGEHQGRDVARRYIETARALSHDHDVELELIDMLASEERVALLVRERFHTADGPVDIRRCNVYRWQDGRIAEIWIFEADQYAVDALFGAGATDGHHGFDLEGGPRRTTLGG
jgi:ketosteroid isomerase-like protein